jgi:hypothetical protein
VAADNVPTTSPGAILPNIAASSAKGRYFSVLVEQTAQKLVCRRGAFVLLEAAGRSLPPMRMRVFAAVHVQTRGYTNTIMTS